MARQDISQSLSLEMPAEKVLQLNIHTLMVDLRYLRVALHQLKKKSSLVHVQGCF